MRRPNFRKNYKPSRRLQDYTADGYLENYTGPTRWTAGNSTTGFERLEHASIM